MIKQYIDDPKCTVIVYENPPFAETTSIEHQKRHSGKSSSKKWKYSYVTTQAKQELKGARSNDMSNVFIWSAFHYYLRQPTDSAVIFSPLKYWKLGDDWFKFRAKKAFAFNRKYFHANASTINTCIMWENIPVSDKDNGGERLELIPYDIVGAKAPNYDTGIVEQISTNGSRLISNRVHSSYSCLLYTSPSPRDRG